jgi:tetraprenyl-beta-curcumene synthase
VIQAPQTPFSFMYRYFRNVFPVAKRELHKWRDRAEKIPDPELRKQALASLSAKRFHADGGCVYAAAVLPRAKELVTLIVALQTISDYLDNLCDRSTSMDPDDFRLLHQSMIDAVSPGNPLQNYYRLRAEREDGGYLHMLVTVCQETTAALPSYRLVQPYILQWVKLYGDLQTYKHVRLEDREPLLLAWWNEYRAQYPELDWWEFAAATGSTLGMFVLFLAALEDNLTVSESDQLAKAYFPWVCGLHILLDYFIDQEEDREGGDLNFVAYYPSMDEAYRRIDYFVNRAVEAVRPLPFCTFHEMVIHGLLGLYLSDPKARHPKHAAFVHEMLGSHGAETRFFHRASQLYRLLKKTEGSKN